MKKRYLSLLLAIVLCLSLLPMAALAASDEPTAEPEIEAVEPVEAALPASEEPTATPEPTAEPTPEVETELAALSLEGELDAVSIEGAAALPSWVNESGSVTADSITLSGNVDLSDKDLVIGQNVTLDLAGYTLTLKTLTLNSGCALTLTDSSEAKTGTISLVGFFTGDESDFAAKLNGTLNANGGAVTTGNTAKMIKVNSGGSITVDPSAPSYTEGATTAFYGLVRSSYGTLSIGIYYAGVDGSLKGNRISFYNGIVGCALEVVGEGRKSIAPIAPTPAAEHLAFEGWYTESTFQNKYTFGSALSDSIKLYAKFEPKPATCTAPTANALTYTGTEQPLVTAGTAEHGKMMYRLGDAGDFSESIPTAKDVGTYTVYYYAEGTGGYANSAVLSVSVTIDPKTVTPTPAPTATPAPTPAPTAKPQSPKTGDEANLALWLALATASALGLGYVSLRKKEN